MLLHIGLIAMLAALRRAARIVRSSASTRSGFFAVATYPSVSGLHAVSHRPREALLQLV